VVLILSQTWIVFVIVIVGFRRLDNISETHLMIVAQISFYKYID